MEARYVELGGGPGQCCALDRLRAHHGPTSAVEAGEARPRHAQPNDETAERALLGRALHLGRIPEGVNGLTARTDEMSQWSLLDHRGPNDLVFWAGWRFSVRYRPLANTSRWRRGGAAARRPAHTSAIICEHSQRRRVIQLHERGLQQAHDLTSDLGELLALTRSWAA